MFVFSNLLLAVAQVLDMGLRLYTYVIIARALISWVNADPYNPIVRFLYNATEPLLYRVRRTVPFAYAGGIDLSPVIVIFAVYFLQNFLVRSLAQLAGQVAY